MYILNCSFYRNNYPDLSHYTNPKLKAHWLTYGIAEGRICHPAENTNIHKFNILENGDQKRPCKTAIFHYLKDEQVLSDLVSYLNRDAHHKDLYICADHGQFNLASIKKSLSTKKVKIYILNVPKIKNNQSLAFLYAIFYMIRCNRNYDNVIKLSGYEVEQFPISKIINQFTLNPAIGLINESGGHYLLDFDYQQLIVNQCKKYNMDYNKYFDVVDWKSQIKYDDFDYNLFMKYNSFVKNLEPKPESKNDTKLYWIKHKEGQKWVCSQKMIKKRRSRFVYYNIYGSFAIQFKILKNFFETNKIDMYKLLDSTNDVCDDHNHDQVWTRLFSIIVDEQNHLTTELK